MTNLAQRIVTTSVFLSGERFKATDIATRFKTTYVKATRELRALESQGLIVRHITGTRIEYARPSHNEWLTKPWVSYHPPLLKKHELTPSLKFIYTE